MPLKLRFTQNPRKGHVCHPAAAQIPKWPRARPSQLQLKSKLRLLAFLVFESVETLRSALASQGMIPSNSDLYIDLCKSCAACGRHRRFSQTKKFCDISSWQQAGNRKEQHDEFYEANRHRKFQRAGGRWLRSRARPRRFSSRTIPAAANKHSKSTPTKTARSCRRRKKKVRSLITHAPSAGSKSLTRRPLQPTF